MSDMLRKLGIEIDIYGNVAGLKQIDAAVAGVTAKAKILGAVLGGAFAFGALKNTISQSLNFADQFEDQAMRLGVSSQELQKWGFVAEQAGVSAETMAKGISFLNKNLGEAQMGKGKKGEGALKLFSEVGITNLKNANGTFKDSGQILLEFSDKLAKLPTAAQKAAMGAGLMGKAGKELGVVLGQGSTAIQEQIDLLMELGGVLPDGVGKQADRLKDKLNAINKSWEVTKAILVVKVVPAIVSFVTWLAKGALWLRNFEQRTGALSLGLAALTGMMGIFLAKSIMAGKAFFLTWMKAALPFVIVAAELFLLFAIVQDLYYFLTGKGDSFIEEFIKQFYGIEKGTDAVNAIRGGFNDFIDVLKGVKKLLDPILNTMDRIAATAGLLKEIRVGGAFDPTSSRTLADVRKEFDTKRGLYSTNKIRGDLLDSTRQTGGIVSTPVQQLAGPDRFLRNYAQPMTQANTLPTTVTNTFNITSNDPQAVGNAVEQKLSGMLVNANENFKTKKAAQ